MSVYGMDAFGRGRYRVDTHMLAYQPDLCIFFPIHQRRVL